MQLVSSQNKTNKNVQPRYNLHVLIFTRVFVSIFNPNKQQCQIYCVLLGGCCQITPEDIARIRSDLDSV